MLDVFAQQLASGGDIAIAAQFENLMVLLIRALHAVSQIKLQPRISFAGVIHVANDGHEMRPLSAGIKDGVKLRIELAPSRDV